MLKETMREYVEAEVGPGKYEIKYECVEKNLKN